MSRVLLVCALLLALRPVSAQGVSDERAPRLPADDRVRLIEAFRLSDAFGEELWPGWRAAPFAVLLVSPTHEYLVRHPRPSADFRSLGRDSLLDSDVFVRRRVFPTGMLATFPAVNGVPTIVMGQPAHTGQHSARWVLTVLHEHFHQLQTSQPAYYDGVAALGLARGDTTGQWMLEFPFPYDSAAASDAFARWARVLHDVLTTATMTPSSELLASLRAAHAALRAALAPDDERYLQLQLWQEGVARYTELRIAQRAEASFDASSAAFRALPDVVPYREVAASIRADVVTPLRELSLPAQRRLAFYPAGAAYALVLDRVDPMWRRRYFTERFRLPSLARPQ